MNLLVIGANGMIGSTMLRILSRKKEFDCYATVRHESGGQYFSETLSKRVITGVDVNNHDDLVYALEQSKPEVVINCAGWTKHRSGAEDPLVVLPVNSLMPHRLAALCKLAGARLIHVSTDCVFAGDKGGYVEDDFTDARDLYGKSKALGELHYPHTVTLRTSTLGPELNSQFGLLEWFLAQNRECSGYTRAIFSGLPTVVFAQIVRDIVIPDNSLSGLYHVAAKPIVKFDLLQLIAKVYGKVIDIVADDKFVIDRSLDAGRFQQATGYVAPEWPELVETMFANTDLD